MLKKMTLKNFRCFKTLELSDLKSINVIIGANGSGKTVLLESLLLGLKGHPNAAMTSNVLRGIQTFLISPGLPVIMQPLRSVFESMWDHFFYQGNKELKAKISFEDSERVSYQVEMRFATENKLPMRQIQNIQTSAAPFVFQRSKGKNKGDMKKNQEVIYSFPDNNNQQQFQGPTGEFGPTTYFFGTMPIYNEQDNVYWFSNLKIKEPKLTEELQDVLRKAFPQIKDLVVLNPYGTASIWANLHSGSTRQLSLVSAGIHKFLTLILACVTLKNGVILIDEIENGIYYSKHEVLWEALLTMSKKNGNQIFATTHSRESLLALGNVIKRNNDANSFRMLRTKQNDDGCMITQLTGVSAVDAITADVELRGP